MISVTRLTDATISWNVWPDWFTRDEPAFTFCTESWINALISLAAAADRCARLRTSAATTANPRPCSPARAASTAAFRARRLVWNAISSMTEMISAIRSDDRVISSIEATAEPTTRPRSEEHTSELQSHSDLVCRLLLEKKKKKKTKKT